MRYYVLIQRDLNVRYVWTSKTPGIKLLCSPTCHPIPTSQRSKKWKTILKVFFSHQTMSEKEKVVNKRLPVLSLTNIHFLKTMERTSHNALQLLFFLLTKQLSVFFSYLLWNGICTQTTQAQSILHKKLLTRTYQQNKRSFSSTFPPSVQINVL